MASTNRIPECLAMVRGAVVAALGVQRSARRAAVAVAVMEQQARLVVVQAMPGKLDQSSVQ
jgi:hypothetical protein